LGSKGARPRALNWSQLQLPTIRGGGLDNPFSEDEVWEAIKASPAEKATGPDGFIGVVFRSCWQTIKHDIMKAFYQFYCIAGEDL
uniref:Reverse transcriptase domain-containing protein n=1 Tax=Aegilops tauschii subsp. strangulata TaxID=200361 RepID=A0A453R7Y2_AEGTS